MVVATVVLSVVVLDEVVSEVGLVVLIDGNDEIVLIGLLGVEWSWAWVIESARVATLANTVAVRTAAEARKAFARVEYVTSRSPPPSGIGAIARSLSVIDVFAFGV